MKRHRVLYVAKTAKGGSAFSLYHLVRGLDGRRYEPVVLFYRQQHAHIGDKLAESGIQTMTLEKKEHQEAPSPPVGPVKRRDIGGWLEARIGKAAAQAYAFLKGCYQFIRWQAPKIWPVVRAIRENDIDLVHLNAGLRHDKPGIIAAWLTRTPCVCHVRMLHQLNQFDKLFANFVDAFVYISTATAKNYIAQGIPPHKGAVVHNAIDLDEFTPIHDAASVRREFGWTPQEQVVGIVGRLDWWKGHEFFLEAMAEVAGHVPSLRGLIVGEPENTPLNREYYQKLQSLTKSLGLEERVIFTGFRSDVPRLLAAMDVVVLSSSAPEPFGRVVIEGMAARKPVVATAAGGVLDIIEDGVNGLLVPLQDSRAMAEAVLGLLSDREKAQQMGSAAYQHVKEKFTVQRQVATIQQLYDVVLRTPKGQRASRELDIGDEAPLKPLPGTESGD